MKDITEKSISDLIYAESVEKPDELKKMKQKTLTPFQFMTCGV